jgi:hypothetical protein
MLRFPHPRRRARRAAGVERGMALTRSSIPEDAADLSNYCLDLAGFLPIRSCHRARPSATADGALRLMSVLGVRCADAAAMRGRRAPRAATTYTIRGPSARRTHEGRGVGGLFHFREDSLRYRGGVAAVRPNLTSTRGRATGRRSATTTEGPIAMLHEPRGASADCDFLAGARASVLLRLKSSLQPGRGGSSARDRARRRAGLHVGWVTRDNIFFRRRAWRRRSTHVRSPRDRSDKPFQTIGGQFLRNSREGRCASSAAFRADGRAAARASRLQLPFFDLRGIPVGALQVREHRGGEVEGRFLPDAALGPHTRFRRGGASFCTWRAGAPAVRGDAGNVVAKGCRLSLSRGAPPRIRSRLITSRRRARCGHGSYGTFQMGNAWCGCPPKRRRDH